MSRTGNRGAEVRSAPTRKMLLELLKPHWRPLTVAGAISVVAAACSLAQPLIVNRIISAVGHGPIGAWVAILTCLVVLTAAAQAGQQFMMTRTAESAVLGMRRGLINRIIRLPMSIHDVHRSGDLVSRLGADTTLIRSAFTGGLIEAFGGALVLVGAVVAMAVLDPVMLAIVLIVGGASIVCVLLVSAKIQHLTLATQESVGDLGASLERAIAAIRTIRASRAEDQIEEGIEKTAETAYSRGVRIARIQSLLWPVSGLAMQVAFLSVLGLGGARVATGALTVADLVTFVLFLFLVSMPLGQVFSAVVTVRSAAGALQRVNQVLSLPNEDQRDQVSSTPRAHQLSLARPSEPRDALVLEGLSFKYDDGSDILTDVSFSVPLSTTTAIVGPSGAGKSTLFALIERFYDPTAGTVLINGLDISSMSRDELRKEISYVEQEAPVLAGTVRENLTLGNPNVTDSELEEVLEQVNLSGRFDRAKGLETVLGERGVNLSGGERQRLAIARAVLSRAPILLLDEPTASVDSHNEELIHEAIRAAAHERTLVVVAHRLSTVSTADQIIVLEQGMVRASGNHDELMRTSALYQSLARSQLLS